jgi:hypothetical protein
MYQRWSPSRAFSIHDLNQETYSAFVAGMCAAESGSGRNVYAYDSALNKAWQLGWMIGLCSAGTVVAGR